MAIPTAPNSLPLNGLSVSSGLTTNQPSVLLYCQPTCLPSGRNFKVNSLRSGTSIALPNSAGKSTFIPKRSVWTTKSDTSPCIDKFRRDENALSPCNTVGASRLRRYNTFSAPICPSISMFNHRSSLLEAITAGRSNIEALNWLWKW